MIWRTEEKKKKGMEWEELVLCEEAGKINWYHNYSTNKHRALKLKILNHYTSDKDIEVFVVCLPNPRFKYKIYLDSRKWLQMEKVEGNMAQPYKKSFDKVN